jgi:hypothetical protein
VDPSAPEPNPPSSPDPNSPFLTGLVVEVYRPQHRVRVFPIDTPGLRSDPGELVVDIYGISELSGEVTCGKIACVFDAAELPVAWPTAAACPASPTGLVVCCGGVN